MNLTLYELNLLDILLSKRIKSIEGSPNVPFARMNIQQTQELKNKIAAEIASKTETIEDWGEDEAESEEGNAYSFRSSNPSDTFDNAGAIVY